MDPRLTGGCEVRPVRPIMSPLTSKGLRVPSKVPSLGQKLNSASVPHSVKDFIYLSTLVDISSPLPIP